MKLHFQDVPIRVLDVIRTLQEHKHQAYLVGGCVRDMLMSVTPKDWDVCTDALPKRVMKYFLRTIPTGIDHGTITVNSGGEMVEVTTFRSESGFTDGRRPDEVEYEIDINADLLRRDFTMNAIAWDPIFNVLADPFDGQGDIERRVIRAVGDVNKRFKEDGLRCIRAIRFQTRMGFEIEPETHAAIGANLETFAKVSIERRQDEFFKILVMPNAQEGLIELCETGLLDHIHPMLSQNGCYTCLNNVKPTVEMRLAALFCSYANSYISDEDLLTPLKLPAKMEAFILTAREQKCVPGRLGPVADRDIRIWIRACGDIDANELLDMYAALTGESPNNFFRVRGLITQQPRKLALDGHEIKEELGLAKPGPLIGKATKMLWSLVLGDPNMNTPEMLRAALREYHE